MIIPPSYTFSSKIVQMLTQIEADRQLSDYLIASSNVLSRGSNIINSDETGWAKYALYSNISMDKQRLTANFFRTWLFIRKQFFYPRQVCADDFFILHKKLTQDLTPDTGPGILRITDSGLYIRSGGVIPLVGPRDIEKHLQQLTGYINDNSELLGLIKAGLSFYSFILISPFARGNWEIACLLFWLVLYRTNVYFPGFIGFGDFLNEKDTGVFFDEELSKQNPQVFLEYLLFHVSQVYQKIKETLILAVNQSNMTETENLLPRQSQILGIIKKKKSVDLRFLHKIQPDISERTIRYHLRSLVKRQLIIKQGETRGSFYTLKKKKRIFVIPEEISSGKSF